MGFDSRVVFPRMMNTMMATGPTADLCRQVLGSVQGEVLEIGFATGLNLPHAS